jgi:hypothetical protein
MIKKKQIITTIAAVVVLIALCFVYIHSKKPIWLHFSQQGIPFEVDYPNDSKPIISWIPYGPAYNNQSFPDVSFGRHGHIFAVPETISLEDIIRDPGVNATFVRRTTINGYNAAIFNTSIEADAPNRYHYRAYINANEHAYTIDINDELGEQILNSFKPLK